MGKFILYMEASHRHGLSLRTAWLVARRGRANGQDLKLDAREWTALSKLEGQELILKSSELILIDLEP